MVLISLSREIWEFCGDFFLSGLPVDGLDDVVKPLQNHVTPALLCLQPLLVVVQLGVLLLVALGLLVQQRPPAPCCKDHYHHPENCWYPLRPVAISVCHAPAPVITRLTVCTSTPSTSPAWSLPRKQYPFGTACPLGLIGAPCPSGLSP